jgi:N-acetylmuramoyl-L-alanine amidase
MRIRDFKILRTALVLHLLSLPCHATDDQETRISSSSEEFLASYSGSRATIEAQEFVVGLRGPRLGSLASNDMKDLIQTIKREDRISGASAGDPNARYDVILQPGHYARPPGAVGTAGALVSERAIASYIVAKIASALENAKLAVLVIPADTFTKDNPKTKDYDGLSAKIFLSIHADGSVTPCRTGPSLGYGDSGSMTDMHQIALALAIALGYEYDEFMKENFTANLSNYYAFKRLRASEMEGILEVGELTCPQTEERLIRGADSIASNVARALRFIVARSK